jgi:hypothetical protein
VTGVPTAGEGPGGITIDVKAGHWAPLSSVGVAVTV